MKNISFSISKSELDEEGSRTCKRQDSGQSKPSSSESRRVQVFTEVSTVEKRESGAGEREAENLGCTDHSLDKPTLMQAKGTSVGGTTRLEDQVDKSSQSSGKPRSTAIEASLKNHEGKSKTKLPTTHRGTSSIPVIHDGESSGKLNPPKPVHKASVATTESNSSKSAYKAVQESNRARDMQGAEGQGNSQHLAACSSKPFNSKGTLSCKNGSSRISTLEISSFESGQQHHKKQTPREHHEQVHKPKESRPQQQDKDSSEVKIRIKKQSEELSTRPQPHVRKSLPAPESVGLVNRSGLAEGESNQRQAPVHAGSGLSEQAEVGEVPAGWTRHWSKTWGKHYLFNPRTGEQRWEAGGPVKDSRKECGRQPESAEVPCGKGMGSS